MKCKGFNCDNPVHYSGLKLCYKHYARFRRHGDINYTNKLSPEIRNMHRRYNSMIQRCHNPNDWAYKDYGARGIRVCDRWRESVSNYIKDLGLPVTPKHSIDRIDNDKGYSPDNCRWALRDIQVHNQRNRAKTGYKGVYKFRKRFRASIMRGNIKKYLGTFDTPEQAYNEYLKARKELYDY